MKLFIWICFIILILVLVYWLIPQKKEYFKQYSKKTNVLVDKSKAFVGAWSSNIECGQGLRYVSLASALPQNWPDLDKFFSNNIDGIYNPEMSSGYTKYLISIGGSNASQIGWDNFLKDPLQTAQILSTAMVNRGIIGVDFDLEGTNSENQNNIKILVNELKKINSNIIIMYTILLGSPQTFSSLIDDNQMDFITLMLYDGGMYTANGSGAGCDWDQWAELFLSGCDVNTCNPLGISYQDYCQKVGKIANYKNKIILGLITDTNTNAVTEQQLKRAMNLCYKYGGRGIFFWVLPGWSNICSQKIICGENLSIIKSYNPTIGNYFDTNMSCPLICPSKVATCCPPSTNGCVNCQGNCISSVCGKKNNITDEMCAACKAGKQTWWPCNVQGYCQCDQKSNTDNLAPCPDNLDPCKKIPSSIIILNSASSSNVSLNTPPSNSKVISLNTNPMLNNNL